MELYSGFSFFALLAILVIPAFILGVKEKPIGLYGWVVTLIFAVLTTYMKIYGMIQLFLFAVCQFIVVKLYLKVREAKGRSQLYYWLFLGVSIMPLVINKLVTAMEIKYPLMMFIGISYMTFKSAQMIIEIYDGIITEVNALNFLYFMLFFPALLSGPIDRSRRFEEDIYNIPAKEEYLEMVGDGLWQLVLGMVYKTVIASAFFEVMSLWGKGRSLEAAVIYMYAYGLYLFFDFAGYSLMAVGIGKFFGINVPMNFDKPFISKDIKEFWDRWHITLSHWFRDFIFSRLTMRFLKKKVFKERLTTASVCFIINMGIMGMWHGLTISYILYGLYHGVLLALTERFQKKSKFYKKHKKDKWFIAVQWFITFNLVMFGFFIFSGRFTTLMGLGK